MDIGNAIWFARKQKGITQEQLAEDVGITVSHLKHIESGHRKPSIDLLFHLVKILDFSLDALIFCDTSTERIIHAEGLTDEDIAAISHLIEIIKKKNRDIL